MHSSNKLYAEHNSEIFHFQFISTLKCWKSKYNPGVFTPFQIEASKLKIRGLTFPAAPCKYITNYFQKGFSDSFLFIRELWFKLRVKTSSNDAEELKQDTLLSLDIKIYLQWHKTVWSKIRQKTSTGELLKTRWCPKKNVESILDNTQEKFQWIIYIGS